VVTAALGGDYHKALSTGGGWLNSVRPGDHVFLGSACGEPAELIAQLLAGVQSGAVRELTAYQMMRGGDRRLVSAAGPDLHLVGLTYHPDLGEAVERGYASFLPISIYEIARSIEEGRLKFDVALVQTSRPDPDGNMSLGVSVDFAAQAVRQSRLVVAQVNDRSPRALGDCFIHVSEIDAAIEVSAELVEFGVEPADEPGRRIAEHVLELVPDRSTIEMGVGAVMTAILEGLEARAELGLHTGLIIEPMVALIEAGVITNQWKGVDQGVSVANQCRGSRRLYDFLDDNPVVSMRPARYTHDPRVLGSLRNFRAINSAIEVDLLGQVNSEFVGGRRISSSGGLTDFVRAALVVDGARSIIALRSTTRSGEQSRIVPRLVDGVTVTADLADVVVTENGIADLRGLPADKRARALIEVADERFRDQLRDAVKSRGEASV
jgi:4-hydroxybutyrate CoA-transferase